MLNRIRALKASTEIDTSVDKQKYITNQALDKHNRTPLCTNCAWDTGAHCRARFGIVWTKEFAEAEAASHAVDSILSSPDVREIESFKSTGATRQTVAMEVNTDQIDERDGGASWQRDEHQLPTMDVTLDQKATTTATKQRARTQLTTNNVESGTGDLRSVAGHQAERADSMLPVETRSFLRTQKLMSVTNMSITLESCGIETSALQSISV